MLDPELISETLEALSDKDTARRRGKHLKPFRGLRGTPVTEIAQVTGTCWKESRPRLPDHEAELHALFCTAFEDGLVAIGLLAGVAPDSPYGALDLVDRWLPLVDDLETADALGWLVLGPSLLASGEPLSASLLEHRGGRALSRRVAVVAALAALPVPVTGPSAAALRVRLGQRQVVFVEEPRGVEVAGVLAGYVRDDDPHVRKAVARVGRLLGEVAPDALEPLLDLAGGLPKKVRESWQKGQRRGRRV
ncbi:MAG TPA: DNA alkylation repair protein [Myxococcota bacterium]|nr:DNA alkylation repair protein [Myxococcota bacterium]